MNYPEYCSLSAGAKNMRLNRFMERYNPNNTEGKLSRKEIADISEEQMDEITGENSTGRKKSVGISLENRPGQDLMLACEENAKRPRHDVLQAADVATAIVEEAAPTRKNKGSSRKEPVTCVTSITGTEMEVETKTSCGPSSDNCIREQGHKCSQADAAILGGGGSDGSQVKAFGFTSGSHQHRIIIVSKGAFGWQSNYRFVGFSRELYCLQFC